jgi:hypothetical protein
MILFFSCNEFFLSMRWILLLCMIFFFDVWYSFLICENTQKNQNVVTEKFSSAANELIKLLQRIYSLWKVSFFYSRWNSLMKFITRRRYRAKNIIWKFKISVFHGRYENRYKKWIVGDRWYSLLFIFFSWWNRQRGISSTVDEIHLS